MLSTTAVNHNSSAAFQAGLVGNEAVPETGMFDFMNYLLGLQGSPQDLPMNTESEIPFALNPSKKEPGNGDEALLSLFDKRESSVSDSLLLSQSVIPGIATPNQALAAEKTPESTLGKAKVGVEQNPFAVDNAPYAHLKYAQSEVPPDSKIQGEGLPSDLKPTAFEKMQKDNAMQRYSASNTEGTEDVEANISKQSSTVYAASSSKVVREVVIPADQQRVLGQPESLRSELTDVGDSPESDVDSVSNEESFNAMFLASNGTTNVGAPGDVVKADGKPEVVRSTLPELFDKVQSMVHHGNGKMTVSLNPPSLGQVEIHVTSRGKNVEIQMRSESALAKSAIESSLSDLKNSMQAQDLHLSKLEVQVSHNVDRDFGTGQFTTMTGHENSFQQSQRFNHDKPGESPWREPGMRSVSGVKAGSPLSGITHAASGVRAFGASSGAGRVDIRI